MPADSGEKTETPSPRRLQEAREKGQVSKSNDLTASVGLLAGLLLLNFYGPTMLKGLMQLLQQALALDTIPAQGHLALDESWRFTLRQIFLMLGPFFLALMVVAVVINLLQVGFIFSAQPITPAFSKISPLAGFKRLFSARTAVRMAMSLAKVAIIAVVAYFYIAKDLPNLISVGSLSFVEVFSFGAQLVFFLGLKLAAILLILGLFDLAFQKNQHQKDLRMTKQEVKEELKRMEGDPLMRQRRRNVARQLANQRMSQAVPSADVVVTNPTHLAIALKYDNDNMPAPKVVARGAGFLAQRIREIALENNVPIIEQKPLAQALYKACDVGDYVPPDLYKAVAEVLAYVFELAGKGARSHAAV